MPPLRMEHKIALFNSKNQLIRNDLFARHLSKTETVSNVILVFLLFVCFASRFFLQNIHVCIYVNPIFGYTHRLKAQITSYHPVKNFDSGEMIALKANAKIEAPLAGSLT